ncbi:MAG: alpha/beta hydrolase [Proteobacteria bacterium]|nr:alpha/beta hydrolase [Pseudomonadota bacterium]
MNITRLFIHGLESSSQGTKGIFFSERYPDMIIEDYKGSLEERMEKLNEILSDKTDLILVGSSFGGLMAAMYACDNEDKVKKLILLAPALDLEEFKPYLKKKIDIPVIIYHGRNDDVVPVAPVQKIAGEVFTDITYNIVNDDHPLRETFTSFGWDELLK